MPYKSKAQQRKFHADPKLQKMAPHWDEETKKKKGGFSKLPDKKKQKKKKKQAKNPTQNKSKQRRIFANRTKNKKPKK